MLLSLIIFIAVLVLLYLLAIMPKLRVNPDFKQFEGWLYAHRGYHNNKNPRHRKIHCLLLSWLWKKVTESNWMFS